MPEKFISFSDRFTCEGRKGGMVVAKIYIAFVDTPGFFANILHRVLKQKYIHVVLAFDRCLEEAYSFGRRNPALPLFSGMEKENLEEIFRAFPTAEYQICEIDCAAEQKEALFRQVRRDYARRFYYHYAVLSLFFVWQQKPFYQRNHFTCSSYLAKVLKNVQICDFGKHFSIVTPKDFYEWKDKKIVFEGRLSELIMENRQNKNNWNGRGTVKPAYEW